MRILVIGAGAVGGYFGARLAEAGRDVTFLVRGRRAEQLRTSGLQITGPTGEFTVQPKLISAAALKAANTPYDLVLLSTKAYSLEPAMDDFAPAVGPGSTILPLLNGMRHLDTLAARFGDQAILGGVARIVCDLDPQGRIVLGAALHEIIYGPRDEAAAPQVQAIDAALSHAGFVATLSPDIMAAMWRKWVLLACLGTICVTGRGTVGQVAGAPYGADTINGIIDEVAGIAAANGHPQATGLVNGQYGRFTDPASTLTSSMYRDLMKGAPVEADHILGDLIARRKDVAAPLLTAAYVQLKVYESGLKV